MTKTPVATAVEKFASLKAAAEDKGIDGVSKETSFKVDPFKIQIRPGFNRPISREHIETIKEALRGGVKLKAIDVAVERTAEKSVIFMVDGEHRMWAVRELIEEYRAGLPSGRDLGDMSAVEFKGGIDEQIAHMLSSGESLGISTLVQGEKYIELMKYNWDLARIAARFGKSETHVKNCLMLANANPDVKQSVRSGEVAGTVAVDIIREHGVDAGRVIQSTLEQVKASGKTKVTPKALNGPSIPRKLATRLTTSFGHLAEKITLVSESVNLEDTPAEMDVVVQLTLPAGELAELLAAHGELAKHRAKVAARAAKATTPEPATEAPTDASA